MAKAIPVEIDQVLPTLVTVTWNTWDTFTSRLVDQVFHYVKPEDYREWIMVDSASDDGDKIVKVMTQFPKEHRAKFTLVRSDQNIIDLPQYNRIIPGLVSSEKVICISTDMRIFKSTVPYFTQLLDFYDMVGSPGPVLAKGAEDRAIGGDWHWVPSLLVARGIDFDTTAHIQTHCFGIRRSAFVSVGGFWEPADCNFSDKGNLISGELSLGVKLRAAGYKLGYAKPPMHHLGNQPRTREQLDQFDREHNWEVDFPQNDWGGTRINPTESRVYEVDMGGENG